MKLHRPMKKKLRKKLYKQRFDTSFFEPSGVFMDYDGGAYSILRTQLCMGVDAQLRRVS